MQKKKTKGKKTVSLLIALSMLIGTCASVSSISFAAETDETTEATEENVEVVTDDTEDTNETEAVEEETDTDTDDTSTVKVEETDETEAIEEDTEETEEAAGIATYSSSTDAGKTDLSNGEYFIGFREDNYRVVDPDTIVDQYGGVRVTTDPVYYTYDGKSHKPTVYLYWTPMTHQAINWVDRFDVGAVEGVDYKVSFSSDTVNAGEVTVTITGIGDYTGKITRTYTIHKAEPKLKITKNATKKYKKSTAKKKKHTFTIKASKKTNAKVRYKVSDSDDKKYIKVNSNGKVTVKKGTPIGTYKITVYTKEAKNYNSDSKTVTVKVTGTPNKPKTYGKKGKRLSAPKKVTVTSTTKSIKVKWKKVKKAKYYEVYRYDVSKRKGKSSDEANWVIVGSTTGKTTFKDTSAKSGHTYYYSIQAGKGSSWQDKYFYTFSKSSTPKSGKLKTKK